MDESEVWLIVGAGGGIGRGIVECVLREFPRAYVIATHRHPLSSIHPRVTWLHLDFGRPDFGQHLRHQLPMGLQRIDRFVACAGVLKDDQLWPEKRLDQLHPEALQRSYMVNAVGPLTAFSAVADRIAVADEAVAVFLSAQVGSIGDNGSGGWYAYRMAKAALNMGVKCLAVETGRWRKAPIVMAVHPGTTLTELSKPFTRRRNPAPRGATDTAARICRLVADADTSLHGRFLNADGQLLPW